MRPVFQNKISPCVESCPAGNPVEELMSFAGAGEAREALRVLKKENPFPGVCGRVCPHPCCASCNRREFDEPLSINIVERLVADEEEKFGLLIPAPAQPTGKKIAVVGAGPAGISCAYHAALFGHSVTILEAAPLPGGLLRYGIPAYRLPRNVLDRELGLIGRLKIELKMNVRIELGEMEKLAADFDAVCIASGAYKNTRLGVENEDQPFVIPVLEFLAAVNSGEKPQYMRHAAVIGGGNSAMDAARAALRTGARDALVIYRRAKEDMPAFHDEIEEAEEEGVKFMFFTNPVGLVEKNGKLKAIRCIRMQPGEPDSSGRPRPVPIPGSEFEVKADTMIEAAGSSSELPLSIKSAPEAGAWGATSEKKIFISGDAGPNARTVAHAVGSGKRAAIAIDCMLRSVNLESVEKRITVGRKGTISAELYRTGGEAPAAEPAVPASAVNFAYFKKSEAAKTERAPVRKRLRGFDEINTIEGIESASREAGRCFNCGVCNDCGNCLLFCPDMSILEKVSEAVPGFDSDHCKGCGICTRECPRGIIEMIEE
jgi:NADPH-dependent glutamate synthase beta subunit-like oxidoreductase